MLLRSAPKLMPWSSGLVASFDTMLEALSVLLTDCSSWLDAGFTTSEGTSGADSFRWGEDVLA